VDRHDRSSPRGHGRGNRVWNDGAALITVDKNRSRADRQDGAHGRDERIRLRDDLIAWADVECS
jgi:hypothetical protein